MHKILDEKVVMRYYLEQMDKDQINFLKGKESTKRNIAAALEQLIAADKINEKIQIASKLWKLLFEASMTFIDPNRQGYDRLFKFFDVYVEFEELIFASDSFYRDHTLHCLWVYFLGEYIYRNEEYSDLFIDMRAAEKQQDTWLKFFEALSGGNDSGIDSIQAMFHAFEGAEKYYDASRCVQALCHDLGYPIKKIEKINKSIRGVLPYFSIESFNDFKFTYDSIQQHFIDNFIELMSLSQNMDLNFSGAANQIAVELFEMDGFNAVAFKQDVYDRMSDQDKDTLRNSVRAKAGFIKDLKLSIAYSNDLENYKHGIMSSFLLVKNLEAFQDISTLNLQNIIESNRALPQILVKMMILCSMANHTRDSYHISAIEQSGLLTFIDELEEFSRISRASQNREYVEEFCSTSIYMEDGVFIIDFIFDNEELDNLNPEIAFKGRCKRFLTLFDIKRLGDNLKLKLRCISRLGGNETIYELDIREKYADILINGESQDIPTYLKSSQFYSKEQYMEM